MQISKIKKRLFISICVIWSVFGAVINLTGQERVPDLIFDVLELPQGGPSNEVRQVFQDKDGFIWIGTNSGLLRFDGYEFVAYKANLYDRNLLTNNAIQALAEDNQHNLWIGTADGLNVLNKPSGKIHKIPSGKLNNNFIQALLATRNGDVWIGTNEGLHQYIAERDSFRLFTYENTGGKFPLGDIKSLIEDSQGQVWIGTWAGGFFRYNPQEDCFYSYTSINPMNSAHVIFEDSKQNIWIGTWGYGLYRLINPYDPQKTACVNYGHAADKSSSLLDNVIYVISEDLNTGTLWVGTRGGLCVLENIEDPYSFHNYQPGNDEHSLSYNEVNSIYRDQNNMMWLGFLGGGINRVDTRKRQFNLHRLEEVKKELSTNSVRSLLQDEEGNVWIGIGSYGLLLHNHSNGISTYYTHLPDFDSFGKMPTINTIMQRRINKELWFGTYDEGIIIYDKKAPTGKRIRKLNRENAPWLTSGCVYVLYEDSVGNIWVGTREGINIITPGGDNYSYLKFRTIDTTYEHQVVMAIHEDVDGKIWLGTNKNGIFRLSGDFRDSDDLLFVNYSVDNQKIHSNSISSLFTDHLQRLWVGTEGEGLVLYDRQQDCFRTMHQAFRLPGDAVFNMEEDRDGYLWLGTNEGLIRLMANDDPGSSSFHLYTTLDGLQDNSFTRNAVFKNTEGELFFGGHKGYNSFFPDRLQEKRHIPPVVITDIRIFTRSWRFLEPKVRERVSALSPEYTSRIVLSHNQNNFNIDFAVLSYANPALNKYAYRLEGFDSGWKYTDAARRFAYYNNLKSGHYRFYLQGANEHGVWNSLPQALEIIVKPAPWATWWAYCIYTLIVAGIIWYFFRLMHKRMEMEAAIEVADMRRQKSEEINHAKLQFFTNITHELMTPLTIISASLDELKMVLPAHSDYYEVLSGNTRRLMRLIQQILEFRKAESGNLKLKVVPDNLSCFVKNSVDSFRPLIKKKGIVFSLLLPDEEVHGYFDHDKLDKILYNLLSNAAKYNREKGMVEVRLVYDGQTGFATVSVKDNGEGISPEAMKSLFKRFYEGNYRRFNTIGTGIGLALTKDLVELHRGAIRVESEKGKGATFIVSLPLKKENYDPEQIDDENLISSQIEDLPAIANITDQQETDVPETIVALEGENIYKILLVEDNEELLQLMQRLLSRDYRVYTAHHGREGVEVVENEEIDLIVSDIMMPEMDGIEFCRYIKGKFELCHIPVILLTAKQSEEDKIEGYDSGADSYLTKPFSLSLLHARIRSVLKNRERIAHDFKKQMVLETKELNYTSRDEEFMQKAVDCVYRHLDDPEFDVEQFVDEMGTSKSTLYIKLKSLSGLHTTAFIRNIRLKAACRLIEEKKKIRISELAYAVGFNDAKYFSACFKKEFGMLPTDYIEKYNSEE